MGLMDKLKTDVKKSGQNKKKIFYVREGQKGRIRFLTDMDDGMELTFHDSFEQGINVPCREAFGKSCDYCDTEGLRTRSQYVWSVWDYDNNEVKLFMFPVNNCTPIPGLMAIYENYGTLLDRDYVVSFTGKAQNKSYTVIPMDKVKFRNSKAKPLSDKAVLSIINKAFPDENDDEDDEDEAPVKTKGKKGQNSTKTSKKKKPVEDDYDEDDYDDDFEDDDEDDEAVDYSEMKPSELFKLCKERDIKVAPKKPAKYYITQLEEYDEAQDDWGEDEDDEDEWED